MKKSRKTKILYKFLLFVLPFIVLSILITSVILTWTSYGYFHKTINQDYGNIIKSSAGEIGLFMEHAHRGLETLSLAMAATKLDSWQKQMALAAFSHKNSEFISVSLISAQGKLIASTRWETQDFVFEQRVLFKKTLSGQTAISDVRLTEESLPFVHIAVPVMRLGQVMEILWGELNLKSVWDVLEGITIGRTGHVYILDLSGRYIAHREIDRVVSAPPTQKPDILKKVRASDIPVKWIEQKQGTRFFCLGAYVPRFDWVIVLEQPVPEIYAYLYRNIYRAILITGLICLISLVLGWWYVKGFMAPIHTLHQQVQRIGQGDLEQKVSIDSKDEIEDLGAAFNDMTHSLKEHIRREVETAKELVHAKNLAVLGTTSGKVTHEVGNLLNNVGMILTLLKDEPLSQKGSTALEVLDKESVRVREFIHNFLQFAKKPDLRMAKISLDSIIKEVMAVHQPEAEKRQIRFQLDWPADLPKINADPRLFYQVMNNLIKNSMEAMSDSGMIRIRGRLREAYLCVAVEDTGPGIAPEVLEQMFDPFYTTKGKKGTGLGMSIVKTIVTAHRGTVECQSDPDKGGTTVFLRFPLS
ncbi:MAG: sensor histidine kinase [Desulfobacterales bacterium]|jgi:two-component system NtrC family sensor kinase